MEDLVPLIFFLVIVAVNGIKFLVERSSKKAARENPQQPNETAPQSAPSSIESFFEKIAEKLEPKPQSSPDYPEDFERPDYAKEMADFEDNEAEETNPAAIPIYIPEPMTSPVQNAQQPAVVSIQELQTAFSGSHGIRIPGMNSFVQSGAFGNADFQITGKADLKRAIQAHVIFSPPRAFDLSFDNTIAK
jgi:hypothetical protein